MPLPVGLLLNVNGGGAVDDVDAVDAVDAVHRDVSASMSGGGSLCDDCGGCAASGFCVRVGVGAEARLKISNQSSLHTSYSRCGASGAFSLRGGKTIDSKFSTW